MYSIQRVALAAIVATALAAPLAAQQPQQNYSQATQADIQRLQDSVFQAGADIQQLKSRDAAGASQLQAQLDDLRDEVIYLKVKLRKEGSLQRSEYASVRDRLDDLRSQATNYTTSYAPSTGNNTAGNAAASTARATRAAGTSTSTTTQAPTAATGREIEVPSGTEVDARLTNTLNSGTAKVEDRFEGTTLV